jgi:hypothetical protein
MNLRQMICAHEMVVHSKKEYVWDSKEVVEDTKYWIEPIVINVEISETIEIFICKKCGYIETVNY